MQKILNQTLRKTFVYFILLVSLVAVTPVTGMSQLQPNDQTTNLEPSGTSDTPQIYLPFSMQRYYVNEYYWQSPFSISIAALNQILLTEPPDSEIITDSTPFQTLLDAYLASGATGTRVEIKWAVIQPEEPIDGEAVIYNWAFYDQALGMIGEAGIQMLVTIEVANKWAVDDPYTPCGPINADHRDDFVDFTTAAVTRYSQPPYNVKFWEIDNEPDSSWYLGDTIGQGCYGYYADRYSDVLSDAYSAIKAIDPYATIVMGGLAYDGFVEYGGNFVREFPDNVMMSGGGNYLDIQNIHYFTDFRLEWERWNTNTPTCGDVDDGLGVPYDGSGIDIIAKAKHYKNRMAVCHGVDKPLWITEIAASSGRENNDYLDWQARYVPQVYARAISVNVGNVSWYGLTTPNQDDGQGLLFEDFSPKPSFFAYQTMTKQLSNYKYHHTLSAPGIEGYAFQTAAGAEKLVMWLDETNTATSATYSLSPATQVLVVDYLGTERVIIDGGAGDMDYTRNGVVKLQITLIPIYVTVSVR
jgi:hypothetical protein